MGRPRFQPTDEQRRMVKSMAAYGMRHEDIAKMLPLKSPKTLRRHFSEELDRGAIEAHAQVAQTCFKMANSGQYPQVTMFWLRMRCHWREGVAAEPAAAPQAPFIVALEKGPA